MESPPERLLFPSPLSHVCEGFLSPNHAFATPNPVPTVCDVWPAAMAASSCCGGTPRQPNGTPAN
jgi:hypothetical protein